MEIKIERFKSLESVEISVNGIALLVGGNNSGKSSVLQAIQFGASVAQTSSLQGGSWSADRLSTSIGQSDLVYSPIKDVLSLARNGRLKESEAEAIRVTYRDGAEEAKITVRKGRNKNIRLELVGATLGAQLQSIQQPYCALVTGLAGIPSEEEFETNVVVRKAAAKGDSNSVFRNILLQLKALPVKWEVFQRQIGSIFPGFQIGVEFDPDINETIECTVIKGGSSYPIDTCGTGVLQAIQIFSYINLFGPRILLLDEPDSHLHPNNQKQLARELIAASEGGLKIIVSTHSRHLVEALIDSSELIWLRNGSCQPDVDNFELEALMEIGALNVGERIGNPDWIFLTEDKNKQAIEVFLEANNVDLEQAEVVSYSGCTQVATAIAMISHLRKTNPGASYVIHRDRDFMSDAELERYRQRFEAMNVGVFITQGNDIESYFVRAGHVAEVTGIGVGDAEELLQRAFAERRDELIERYVNSRIEGIKKAGGTINAGEISVEGVNLLTGPASQAVHGKTLLKGVREQIKALGHSEHIMCLSAALRCDAFQDVVVRMRGGAT